MLLRRHLILLIVCWSAPTLAFWDPVTSECRPPALEGTATAIDGHTLKSTRVNGLVDIIRLVSIDAPELHQDCRIDGEWWSCGFEARQTLDDLLADADLTCLPCGYESDGAITALCRSGETDIGAEVLRAGMATSYAFFANNLQSAEGQAVTAGRGVWQGDWVHPTQWRQGTRLREGPCVACYIPR